MRFARRPRRPPRTTDGSRRNPGAPEASRALRRRSGCASVFAAVARRRWASTGPGGAVLRSARGLPRDRDRPPVRLISGACTDAADLPLVPPSRHPHRLRFALVPHYEVHYHDASSSEQLDYLSCFFCIVFSSFPRGGTLPILANSVFSNIPARATLGVVPAQILSLEESPLFFSVFSRRRVVQTLSGAGAHGEFRE